MMTRKASFGSRGRVRGNARPAAHRPTATVSPKAMPTTATGFFVEFHPSMSLENAPTLAECILEATAPTSTASSCSDLQAVPGADDASLEGVLAVRCEVWTKVNEVIEKLTPIEAYRGDVHALRKLQQLHLLCKQRETHLRTLQITLLQEGRTLPPAEAKTTTSTPAQTEDDKDDVDDSTTNQGEWQQEQQRYQNFVDYDAMDLIELSEHVDA